MTSLVKEYKFSINKLIKNPENHDKVEFKIAETSYRFESLKYLQKNIKIYLIKEK